MGYNPDKYIRPNIITTFMTNINDLFTADRFCRLVFFFFSIFCESKLVETLVSAVNDIQEKYRKSTKILSFNSNHLPELSEMLEHTCTAIIAILVLIYDSKET